MKLTVAELLARFLNEADVPYVFGVSGHPLFDILDAIYRQPGVDLVPSQMELTGAYMANGFAVAGRRLGACIGSAGPGVTNLLTGAAEAFKESTPLFVLGADVDHHVANKGTSSWHELPQAEVMAPVTKLSCTLRQPDQVLERLVEAHRLATTGRTGPVYLGFPPDVQEVEVTVPDQPWISAPPAPPVPDAAAIERAAVELANAAMPTILLGGGVYWAQAGDEARVLAEELLAPLGTSHTAKGVVPEDHPYSLGVVGFGSFPFADRYVAESDVLLAVGTTFSEGMTRTYGHAVIPEHARIIQIDLDPQEIGKCYPAEIGIVADARQALAALTTAVRQKAQPHAAERRARLERLKQDKDQWLSDLNRRGSPSSSGPITHAHIMRAVQEVVPADARLIAAGCTGELLSRTLATAPVYESGDFRAIGHGLSSAIGIKHALPDRQVVAVTGDGSFMMELSELATARRTGQPLVVVVVDNRAYGSMKRDQVRHYGGRIIGTELTVPDLVQMAESFGLWAQRVEEPTDLEPALRSAMGSGGPALLDVVCPVAGL